jgi:hypothetical protein
VAKRLAIAAVLALALLSAGEAAAAGTRSPRCDLGPVRAERTLLEPRVGTFYSVDALNPDVVKRGGTYHLFFSGNSLHTPGGQWRTGVATARSPLGPFRVWRGFAGDFLNGGTAVWRGRFWQAYTHNRRGGELAMSRDGVRWGRVAAIPNLARHGFPLSADYFLERVPGGLRMYMLVRRALTGLGGGLATIDWRRGRWRRFRTLLFPSALAWESADIGEPAAVRLRRRRHLLFYTATAGIDARRTIGFAAQDRAGRWRRCGKRPVIGPGARWAPDVSIDPSLLVEGDRVYVYYGGGRGLSIAADLAGAIGVRVYELPRARGRLGRRE